VAAPQSQTIASKLWAMANELRGNMDASEYKNYILGFMFYRYLSEHQEHYLLDQDLITPRADETPAQAYTRQVGSDTGGSLEDYLEDISSTLGYAINPEDMWSTLVSKVETGQVAPSDFQDIFDHFNANSERNASAMNDFRGVFNDISLGDSRLGTSTTSRAKSLSAIVSLVKDIAFTDDSGKDILGDIYEYLIGQFAATAGKKGGEFYTPHQISTVLAKIVTEGVKETTTQQFTVYDPTLGSGSLLLTVRHELPGGERRGALKFLGQELNTSTYNLARMNLMMRGVDYTNMQLRNADTLETDWPDGEDEYGIDRPRTVDFVVMNPPYSAKWANDDKKLKDPRWSDYGRLAPASKADYAFLLHGLYHLNATGTMGIVLPHGVLFRGASEGVIRETLIRKNYLDAVIGLPPNLFYGTSIPTVILILKRNKTTKDILFIDASADYVKGKNQNALSEENIAKIVDAYQARRDVKKYAHVADLDEIEANDFNLNIPRYVDTFEEESDIDINQVYADLAATDAEITGLRAQFDAMVAQLVETDEARDISEATEHTAHPEGGSEDHG
jgi:type I restriction enzyme M protein